MARENNGADKKTHTRLKDCSSHRNISNVMEEASPSNFQYVEQSWVFCEA